MPHRRRTKKLYKDLYDKPNLLCPPSATSEGADVTLFPNGEDEIWVKTADGLGFSVTFGHGPHGLSVRVRKFVGSPSLTAEVALTEETEIAVTQYRQTENAQAFRRWYQHAETEADILLLGEGYRRTPEIEASEARLRGSQPDICRTCGFPQLGVHHHESED